VAGGPSSKRERVAGQLVLEQVGPQGVPELPHPRRRRQPAAEDVADHHADAAGAERQHVEPVTTDVGGRRARQVARRQGRPRDRRQAARQQRVLQLGRGETGAFVEARPLEGMDAHACQRVEVGPLVRAQRAAVGEVHHESPDRVPVEHQRQRQSAGHVEGRRHLRVGLLGVLPRAVDGPALVHRIGGGRTGRRREPPVAGRDVGRHPVDRHDRELAVVGPDEHGAAAGADPSNPVLDHRRRDVVQGGGPGERLGGRLQAHHAIGQLRSGAQLRLLGLGPPQAAAEPLVLLPGDDVGAGGGEHEQRVDQRPAPRVAPGVRRRVDRLRVVGPDDAVLEGHVGHGEQVRNPVLVEHQQADDHEEVEVGLDAPTRQVHHERGARDQGGGGEARPDPPAERVHVGHQRQDRQAGDVEHRPRAEPILGGGIHREQHDVRPDDRQEQTVATVPGRLLEPLTARKPRPQRREPSVDRTCTAARVRSGGVHSHPDRPPASQPSSAQCSDGSMVRHRKRPAPARRRLARRCRS
jgi:hypothetical protein